MKVVEQPSFFDSLHTLNVWTPYGRLMRSLHESFNGQTPYKLADIYLPEGLKCFTKEQIIASFAKESGPLRINFNDRKSNYIPFEGVVVGMHVATPSAFVLTLSGEIFHHVYEVPVTMSCFYETGDYGCNFRGFCLLPELAWQQIGCSN